MSMLTDAGAIQLILHCRDDHVSRVDIRSTRPSISPIFAGQPADKVVSLVPMLFSLCGKAHGLAARSALAAARGEEILSGFDPQVAQEAALEHLWHLLFTTQRDAYMVARRAILSGGYASVFEELAGLPAEEWLSLDTSGMEAWAAQGNGILARECQIHRSADEPENALARLLPEFSAQQSLREWPRLTDAMTIHPTWQGPPAETGAFARQKGLFPLLMDVSTARPLLARWLARVIELANLLTQADLSGSPNLPSLTRGGPGRGLAAGLIGDVETKILLPGTFSGSPIESHTKNIRHGRACVTTARGLLMHEITLQGDADDGRVLNYCIVAPTEWNFHPEGALRSWLLGRLANEDLRELAGRCVRALDPCVAWSCEIREEED